MEYTLSITQKAAQRLTLIKSKKANGQELFLRIMILGGGCSGFQYNMKFDHEINDDDYVFEEHNEKVVADKVSLKVINNSTVDYKEELIGSNFVITNPNASISCGCGGSFSV